MKITQISMFLENKKGRLYEVTSLLGKNHINIRALTIAESEDFGVLRMVVDKTKKALEVFKEKGYVATITDIVAVEVEDDPGGLAHVLKILSDNNINVEYMYGFAEKFTDKAILVFRFNDQDLAIKALKENRINVIEKNNIQSF